MEDERFDRLARSLAQATTSRRLAARLVGAGAVAAVVERIEDGVALAGDRRRERCGDKRWIRSCRSVSKARVRRYIRAAARRYNQPYKRMLCVAECESELVNCAVNAPGETYGLFQFKCGTWESTKYRNKDLWDPKWNAMAAAWMWSQGRENEWDCCCPKFKCRCPGKRPSWC